MLHLPPPQRSGPRTAAAAGFSLVELVIAVVLLMTSLMMGVLSGQSNLLTMGRNLNMSSQESLIEEDIAQIRSLAERFTWCSGAGRTAASAGCRSQTPLSQDYYFPEAPPPSNQPDAPPPESEAINAFTEACRDSRLTAALVGAINALPRPDGLNLERQAGLLDERAEAGTQTHVLRIRYRYDRPNEPERSADFPPIDRDVLILPTVAAWCP